jgi:hypothetical protein
MARGRRSLVVAQAMLFGASANAEQVQWYIATGSLECKAAGADPEPIPYNADALKALHASGQLG